MAIHYGLLTKIINAVRWLFGFCETSAIPVKPVEVVLKVDCLEDSNKFYEFDKYQEYERFRQIKEKLKVRQIMLS